MFYDSSMWKVDDRRVKEKERRIEKGKERNKREEKKKLWKRSKNHIKRKIEFINIDTDGKDFILTHLSFTSLLLSLYLSHISLDDDDGLLTCRFILLLRSDIEWEYWMFSFYTLKTHHHIIDRKNTLWFDQYLQSSKHGKILLLCLIYLLNRLSHLPPHFISLKWFLPFQCLHFIYWLSSFGIILYLNYFFSSFFRLFYFIFGMYYLTFQENNFWHT